MGEVQRLKKRVIEIEMRTLFLENKQFLPISGVLRGEYGRVPVSHSFR